MRPRHGQGCVWECLHVGAEFPDAIHQLTATCRGNVYKIHNAADFAEAIEKMQRKAMDSTEWFIDGLEIPFADRIGGEG